MSGQPQQRTLSYESCFLNTLRRRLRYVNKICFLVALFASIILRVPHGRFWWNLVDSIYRVPALFAALYIVRKVRDQNSVVDFSTAKSLAEQIAVSSVFSRRFYATLSGHLASAALFFAVFLAQTPLFTQYYVLAKEFRVKPAANDAWVYFWFHAGFCAVVYTLQHVWFQRNRLNIAFGAAHVTPETQLFTNTPFLFGSAAFFAAFCSAFAPLTYLVARPFIYKICWPLLTIFSLDTATPPFRIGFTTYCNVTYASFVLFVTWEATNHVYNTYATIGCIDGKLAISGKSADPVATILSGLRDVNPEKSFIRTTAFQELAYIASSKDAFCVKTRNALFNGHAHKQTAWQAILGECVLVIRTTSLRVNFRSKSDMDALKNADLVSAETTGPESAGTDPAIFGNSNEVTSNDTTDFAVSAVSSPLKPSTPFAPVSRSKVAEQISKYNLGQKFVNFIWAPLNELAESIYGPPVTRQKLRMHTKTSAWQAAVVSFYEHLLASGPGLLFRHTVKRDAEARILNPALYGSAVIGLASLLMHAVEEDRSDSVSTSQISEVLNVLERPIRSCKNYTEVLPASVYVSPAEKRVGSAPNDHLVASMHDLTIAEFYRVCVKYNYKLNDLQLSSRALKLAKWVTDVSVAQQQQEEKVQMKTFL